MAVDLFRSERLVYRKVEPLKVNKDGSTSEPENDPFGYLLKQLTWDSSRINATPRLWEAPGVDYQDGIREYLTSGKLLSVYICLPKEKKDKDSSSSSSLPSSSDEEEKKKRTVEYLSDAENLTAIGEIHLSGTLTPRHSQHRKGGIGLMLLSEYQGKGYGSEAIRWITDWGFRVAGLHRIDIGALSWNAGALRVYDRLGFVREGVSRETCWFMGGWRDHVDMAMLEHEFWEQDWVKAKGVSRKTEDLSKLFNCA